MISTAQPTSPCPSLSDPLLGLREPPYDNLRLWQNDIDVGDSDMVSDIRSWSSFINCMSDRDGGCHNRDIPPHPVHPQSRLHVALFALNSPHPNPIHTWTLSPLSLSSRCRACSTTERTATNIVQAPIAHAHCAPRAPHSSCLCSLLLAPALTAPCSRCSLSRCLLLTHAPAPAPCSCSFSLLFAPARAAHSRAHAPFTRSSLLGFGTALGHFRAPHVHAIPYLGFASQRLA